MPVSTTKFIVQTYHSALSLPPSVWAFFTSHQRHTNVIYPVAERLLQQELAGVSLSPDTFWMTCSTTYSSNTDPTLDFVLSCTPGPQGSYPIFICTTAPFDKLCSDYIYPRIEELVRVLYTTVPLERVYSVFAPEPITRIFASLWTKHTGIALDHDPEYYSAKLTFCTLASFRNRRATPHPERSYILRQAVETDIPAAADLCHGFAAVSEPFVLSHEGAVQEATDLIRKNQLWVHEVIRPNQPPRIASIVAITRTSESAAGITKVFTDPNSRNMGCAERLVRVVCDHLLKTHESVVLYVAHNNPAANVCYNRVGFRGLESGKARIDGVEDWLELGFDRNHVELGHW